MAIMIKGLDMPETCSGCMFEFGDFNPDEMELSLFCLILDNAKTDGIRETGRLDNCPLRKANEPKPYESRKKLPCPKCGTPRPKTWFSGDMAGVRCQYCGLEVWSKTEIAAIRAWNAMKREA